MEKVIKLSTTQLIEVLYHIDNQKLKEVAKNLNFLEDVTYFEEYKGRQYKAEASLAENIVKTLPIDIYKDLVTLEGWFTGFNKDKNPITVALFEKKFEFIELALDLLEKKITEEENKDKKSTVNQYNQDYRTYSEFILQRILSFPIKENLSAVGYTKKDIENSYFNIFSKALDLYVRSEKYIWIGVVKKKDLNEISFVEKLDSLMNPRINSTLLLKESCEQKSMYIFFAKIMNDISEEKKEEIKNYPKKSLLSMALLARNKKVSDFLIKENLYCDKAILDIIDTINKDVLETKELDLKQINIYSGIFNTCENLLSEKEKKDIPAYKLMGMLRIKQSNEKEANAFLSSYPQITQQNIIEGDSLSLKEVKLLKELEQHFFQKYNVEFDRLNKNQHYVSVKELVNFSNEEADKKDFADKIRNSNVGLMTKFKLDIYSTLGNTSGSKENATILENELLEFSLPKQEIEEKKKLKV